MWEDGLLEEAHRQHKPSDEHGNHVAADLEGDQQEACQCSSSQTRCPGSAFYQGRLPSLMRALLDRDDEEDTLITEVELCRALGRGKATAPRDDGATYSVLRLLHQVPVNPILQPMYIIFATVRDVCLLPGPLVRSSPSSSQVLTNSVPFHEHHVSVKSWSEYYCPICTGWKMCSRFNCSASCHSVAPTAASLSYYTRLSSSSMVAFIDLKSALDTANRDTILDQLLDLTIKGRVLKWIRHI
ncbi:hypothetical protein E2C01_046051 [Portunus trituberculatus]|uniref:Uncharacterized protein n=1 Tax=Portunus trituberculatus TaxID=210409 RepID=A0A5B7G3R5_PORTR|nr:hypothetical protein [Portunus trituberculatus]